jgi:hypothetical protein
MGPNVRGTTADVNDNRTLTGRVGLVRLGGIDAELGLSFASGDLAEPGSFTALGSDLVLGLGSASLRSYLYSSTEDTGPVDIDRSGFTVEPMYTISLEKERLSALSLLVRYSQAEEDDPTGTLTRSQLGVGVVGQITSSLRFRAGFMSQGEDDDLPDADNNAITFSITNEF